MAVYYDPIHNQILMRLWSSSKIMNQNIIGNFLIKGVFSEWKRFENSPGLRGGYTFTQEQFIKRVLKTTENNKFNEVLTFKKQV